MFWKKRNQDKAFEADQGAKESIVPITFQQILCSTKKEVVFICIGSDRSIADSVGPLVGTMLKEKGIPCPVYGTLEEPVHALNLNQTLKEISRTFDHVLLIAIDACIGEKDQVGSLFFKQGPLFPGKAIGKSFPPVGDFHFIAVVNDQKALQGESFLTDTRLFTVYQLAREISDLIVDTVLAADRRNEDESAPRLS